MIRFTRRASEQYSALIHHYKRLDRPEAIDNLRAARLQVSALIEGGAAGLPAPRPYPELATPGESWLKVGRYWFAYSITPTTAISAVFYDTANIPKRRK